MEMKIAIFETGHFEVANTLVRLFDNSSNTITLFVYKSAYEQLQFLLKDRFSHYNWIVKEDNESARQFIYRMYKAAKKEKFDLLYLDTVADNFIFYALFVKLLGRTRTVVTIHDINGHFTYKPSLSIKRLFRFIGKRMLVRNVKEFNVIAAAMANQLKQKLPPGKKVYNLPGAVFYNEVNRTIGGELKTVRIVVPGSVDYRRRDYTIIFRLLEKINGLSLPVTITLLGGFDPVYGNHILEKCRQYAGHARNLAFYETDMVEQPEFDRVMTEASIVCIPSHMDVVINDGVKETYGISICSGGIFDVVRFAKPFIIPQDLTVDDRLNASCLRYINVDDIVAHLQKLLSHPGEYAHLREQAHHASMEYTVDKVRERNADLFKG